MSVSVDERRNTPLPRGPAQAACAGDAGQPCAPVPKLLDAPAQAAYDRPQ
jgi:hypothetical protein